MTDWLGYAQTAGEAIKGLGSFFSRGYSSKDGYEAGNVAYRNAKIMAVNLPTYMKQGWENAGIHPIYGMGGSSAQFSPSMPITGSDSVGERIASMGNSISRAAEALITSRERLQNRLLEAQVEGQEIENQKKASDLAVTTHAGTPGLNLNPLQHGDLIRNRDGSVMLAMSQDAKDRLDEDLIGQLEWNLRNRLPFIIKRELSDGRDAIRYLAQDTAVGRGLYRTGKFLDKYYRKYRSK